MPRIQFRRLDALRFYGYKAVQLLFAIALMLVVAGTIEGFFSLNPHINAAIKYLVGITLFTLLVLDCSKKSKFTS